MEAYYVINNRIPRFPISSEGKFAEKHQEQLREGFQRWLIEKVPSNLLRRRACSQCFEFAKWLEQEGIRIENVAQGLFTHWLQGNVPNSRGDSIDQKEKKKLVDFDEFLSYARHKVPEMKWSI